jgi:hypothetical protein
MRLGYIRVDRAGPTREEQEAALRAAGLEDFTADGPVYVDAPPKRRPQPGADAQPALAEAVRALRADDEIAIHSPARLGATRGAVLDALERIGQAGAAVYDCAAGAVVRFHPDAAAAIRFAAEAESQGQRERAAKARRGITRKVGPPAALSGKRLADAKGAWTNPETSAQQVADASGASVRTLYRLFGPKGTPLFGKKEKPRGR